MMKIPMSVKIWPIVLTFALCAGAAGIGRAAETPKRGDYPKCQETCVLQLKTRMTGLSDDYGKSGNRLVYEERVGQARSAYDSCIDNCREPLPVK
jgi:hypothetical protein